MKSKFLEYFDFEKANKLLEGFNQSTGFVTAIVDLDGNVLSKSGWRKICADFHRVNPDTALNCRISDTELTNKTGESGKFHFYQCMNGLIDVQTPIVISGEHVANLFSGQFFFENPDLAFFKRQAKLYGFDESSYLEALGKVPVVSKEEVEMAMKFMLDIIQIITELTAEKLEQIELNEALIESEKRYRQLSEQSRTFTWEVDDQGLYTFVDPVSELVLGYHPEELIHKKHFYDLFPEEVREEFKQTAFDIFGQKSQFREFENKVLTKSGQLVVLSTNGFPILKEDGSLLGYRGSDTDITERKLAEEDIRKQNNLFASLLKLLPVGVFMVDATEGKPLVINDMGKALLGSGILPDANEHNLSEVYKAYKGDTQQHYPIDEMPITLGMKGISSHIDDMIVETPDGTRKLLEVFGTPVNNAKGKPWASLVTFMDITDRKKNEKELLYLSYNDHLTGLDRKSVV